MTDTDWVAGGEADNPVFRVSGISFLRIPAANPQRSADFYRAVFDWKIRADSDEPGFEEAPGM
jgi:predicted enzyme related to lactoylglutathione lyase